MVKGKGWGASAIGVRGFLLVKARSLRFGPSLFYHLHEKYEIKHAMADIVANADYCQESDLNEMTTGCEKGKPGKISRPVGQFSRAEAGQFWRALKPRGWDAFVISVSLIDHVHSGMKGLPSLTIDVAAPETLSANSVTDMDLGGVTIRAYTLERITGEKARAFLSTLPTYRRKAQRPGEAVRVKDLYDIASIARLKPLSDIPFWTTAGNEFRLACESRGIDCIGRDSFAEGWAETREHYQKEPIIPKDIRFTEVEGTIDSILDFWKNIGIVPFISLLPEKTR